MIIRSGSVTQANMRLSSVDGTAFVDFSLASVLTLNAKLTITDSASKTLIGYFKAAGTGETTGAEKITGWTNNVTYSYDTFTTSGTEITSAIIATGVGIGYTNSFAPTSGILMKMVTTLTINSGAAPKWLFAEAIDGSGAVIQADGNGILMSAGANIVYRTAISGLNYLLFYNSGAQNFSTASTLLKQVLTPSTTGATIVSAAGGSIYNWTSMDSGFNLNDSGGYTYILEAADRMMLLGVS